MTQWSSRWKRFCLQCAYWVRQGQGVRKERSKRSRVTEIRKEKNTHTLCFRNPLLTELSVSTEAKRHPGWGCVTHPCSVPHWPSRVCRARWNELARLERPPGWTVDQEKTNMGSQFPDWGSNLHSLHWRQSLNYWTARESLLLIILDAAGHTFWS